MAAMAMNTKTFKKCVLQSQKAYDFEILHEASSKKSTTKVI